MSRKGLNARRKQNCGGNPTQKLHHHSLVAQSQRVETHGTRSVKLWAAFHHKSYCFAPKCWSHTKQCCLHLCERQTDCSETVFLWVKSCKEYLCPLSDTAQHSMLWEKCRRTDFNFARFFGVRDSGTPRLGAANFVRVQSCTHFAQVCAQ